MALPSQDASSTAGGGGELGPGAVGGIVAAVLVFCLLAVGFLLVARRRAAASCSFDLSPSQAEPTVNFVDEMLPYYHGKIDRLEAERALRFAADSRQADPDAAISGLYLFRASSGNSDVALSVTHQPKGPGEAVPVSHFLVGRTADGVGYEVSTPAMYIAIKTLARAFLI